MDVKEAFTAIIGALHDVENFEEQINVVSDALNAPAVEPSDSGFEAKYNALRDAYVRKFGEMESIGMNIIDQPTGDGVQGNGGVTTLDSEPVDIDAEEIRLEDIDFDGSSES